MEEPFFYCFEGTRLKRETFIEEMGYAVGLWGFLEVLIVNLNYLK